MFIRALLRLLPLSVYCFSKSKTRRYFVYCAGLYPASSPPQGAGGLRSLVHPFTLSPVHSFLKVSATNDFL